MVMGVLLYATSVNPCKTITSSKGKASLILGANSLQTSILGAAKPTLPPFSNTVRINSKIISVFPAPVTAHTKCSLSVTFTNSCESFSCSLDIVCL